MDGLQTANRRRHLPFGAVRLTASTDSVFASPALLKDLGQRRFRPFTSIPSDHSFLGAFMGIDKI
jgi:hypothetical protein